MKKKFFFKFFLFTVIATMVTFTACKDYDDDISDLQNQITNLSSMSTDLTAAKADIAAAKTSAADALAKAKEALEAAQNAGDADAIAAAQAAADAAQEKADEVEAKATELEGLIQALEARVVALEAADSPSKAELQALADEIAALQEDVIAMSGKMVTSVAIVSNTLIANNNELTKFSALTEFANVFVKDLPGAITFTKGKQIQTGDFFIIQVSPADANVTPEMITIQNGKGEVYDNLKVTKVERYSELLTRASTVNTGLWKVSVELIAYDKTAFDKATEVDGKKVAFAVAIGDDERRELSAYDLTLTYGGDYSPLGLLDFKVDDVNVADINNRYDNTSKSLALSGAGTLYNEQTWKDDPATAMTDDNTTLDDEDNRSLEDVYPAVQGKPIKITLADAAGKIRGMYISLDYKDNAIDSAPSEWAAWNSFSYTGLNSIVEGTEAEFTINSEDAINDIIGFRVFAVNHDGTLVDPDGRAFYVSLGEEAADWDALNTVVTAVPQTPGQVTSTESAFVDVSFDKLTGANEFAWVTDKADNDAETNPAFHVFFVDAKGDVLFDTKGGDVKGVDFSKVAKVYTKATVPNWLAYEDNKEYKGALTIKNATNHVLSTVNVTFKKVLPTAGPTDFSVKTNQIVGGVYTAYLVPDDWVASSATAGTMPLSDVFNFGASAADIVTTFAKSDGTTPNLTDVIVKGESTLTVGKDFVDNATKHATTVAYNYGKISTATVDEDDNVVDYTVTIEEFETVFSNIYNDTYSWDWATKAQLGKGAEDDIGYKTTIEYGTEDQEIDLGHIFGVSTRDSEYNASLRAPYKGSLNVVSAKLVSNANQVAEYFTVTPDPLEGAKTFTLVPASGATNPTADVASTLILTAKDMYDNDITIELPFTVKKR